MATELILEASGIAKSFGSVTALSNASMQVAAGEVVALMGANGAGKSTLVKILTGVIRPDTGSIRIRGREHRVHSPAEARQTGLVPVYQEPSLIPDLDVAANLRLSRTPVEPFLHWVAELGIAKLDLGEPIRRLPLATLRILDLARALASEPGVILLDEMTAALPTDLVERVLKVVRQQCEQDRSVIYISHRFAEISALCDRATVLRDGETVGTVDVAPGTEEEIVEMMLGAPVKSGEKIVRKDQPASAGKGQAVPRLRVEGLAVGTKLSDVSFDMRAGEVLGVVALEGQGQDELFEVLAGFERPTGGRIEIDGDEVRFHHPADAIAAGHVYVPGDRADALLMQRSVRENIALPFYTQPLQWGNIRMGREKGKVDAAIKRLQIDTRAQGEVQRLSGGNQQKVTIARWIATGVRTLLCFDPTRGIDIRTKREIYPLLRELAEQGSSVLLYTSELEEVHLACDRAVVIFNGHVVDVIDAEDADEPTLMRAAYGLTVNGAASASAHAETTEFPTP